METTRQTCPECGATLELPASAIGRKARCPACQATFVIAPANPHAANPRPPSPQATGPEATPPGGSLEPPLKPREPAGSAGGFGPIPVSQRPGEAQRPGESAGNPYAVQSGMASAAMEPVKHGELLIRTPSIDSIVSTSWAIFTERWQPLVIGGLILFGYNILSSIAGQIVPAVAGGLGEEILIAATFLFQVISSLLGFYITCGIVRVALAVARNQPAPAGLMFPPPAIFGRVIVTMLIPLLALIVLGGLLGGIGMAIYLATGQADEAGLAMLFIGGLLFMCVYLAMFFLLWPAFYLASDEQSWGRAALRTGFSIGIHNKLNSFLFMLINMALALIGLMTCCVGQIATTPAMFLVAGVGYLMMTSQPVSDPTIPPLAAPFAGGQQPFGNPGYGEPQR